MWLHDKQKNIAMSCLPKNGSHSLRETLRIKPVKNSDIIDVPIRIGWIRNWRKRLESAFSFYRAVVKNKGDIGGIPVDSYESFIDHVLSVNGNHWDSQVELLTYKGLFLPTVCHRFEDINRLWGNYYTGFIPQLNGCVHEVVSEYRNEELKEKYRADEKLWQSL